MTLYDDLGVPREATEKEIRAAYRKAAKAAHPDAGGTAKDFARIQRALAVLKDPRRRQRYDTTGEVDEEADNARAKLIELLATILKATINEIAQPDKVDLVASMLIVVRQVRDNLKNHIKAATDARAKWKKIEGRWHTRMKGTPNAMEAIVANEIAMVTRSIAEATERLALLDEAEKVIKDHGYEHEVARPVFFGTRRGTTSTSGSW